MRTVTCAVLGVVLGGVGAVAFGPGSMVARKGPGIARPFRVDTQWHDHGTGVEGQLITGYVSFENTGARELMVHGDDDCDGCRVEVWSGGAWSVVNADNAVRVPGGAKTDLRYECDVGSGRGVRIRRIVLTCSDGEHCWDVSQRIQFVVADGISVSAEDWPEADLFAVVIMSHDGSALLPEKIAFQGGKELYGAWVELDNHASKWSFVGPSGSNRRARAQSNGGAIHVYVRTKQWGRVRLILGRDSRR